MTETRATYAITPDGPTPALGRDLRNRPAKRSPRRRLSSSGAEAGFPGCEAVSMNAEQFERCDRHVEYWDAQDGVAWMVRDVSIEHERPLSRLAVLVHRIAEKRGAPMLCCGTTSLYDRDSVGNARVMEADQAVYLDGVGAQAIRSPILIREGQGPDIVLEVDHTTDSRRHKLGIYEEWCVPEVWIEVPDAPARGRPKSRRSGLAIYVFDEKTKHYREAAASEALPGWTAAEIHLALNEGIVSESTLKAVARVGQTMREQEGNEPLSPNAFATRVAAERTEMVYAILARRGISFVPDFLADDSSLAALDVDRIVEAALACDSAADFLVYLAALQP